MATWKKVIVSGSDISQLSNDANYLVNAQSGATSNWFLYGFIRR
jgi:hypothetical protein